MARTIRSVLVDSPDSLGARSRAQRWEVFRSRFPQIGDMRVLDLGGTVSTWARAPLRPAHVTVLNLFEPGEATDDRLTPVLGDACAARAVLTAAGQPTAYDLVFSNSLIEHVGGHAHRARLAREVRELAPYHWVQTPYRYFPVEPHWIFPFMQFLPMPARRRVAERWPLAHTRPDSAAVAMAEVQAVELIGITELRSYFPASMILKELVLGLPKSITAVLAPRPGDR